MSEGMLERGSGGPSLAQLKVADVMHPGVVACSTVTPLRYVARMMAAYRIHAVAVFSDDEAGEVGEWKIVSDLDLVRTARTADFDESTLGDVKAEPALTVTGEDALAHAAELMDSHRVAHLVVVDRRSARPLGVVSTIDIVRALGGFA